MMHRLREKILVRTDVAGGGEFNRRADVRGEAEMSKFLMTWADAAMSAETVDATAAAALSKQAATLCETCHAKYREQDPTTKAYRVRSDLLR